MTNDVKLTYRLAGAELPEIEVLRGYYLIDDPADELIRRAFRLDEGAARSLIEGAQWTVAADGEFSLTSAPTVGDARLPRSGTGQARSGGGMIVFHAAGGAPGFSLDGVIFLAGEDEAQLDAVYTSAAAVQPYVARIKQRLRRQFADALPIPVEEPAAGPPSAPAFETSPAPADAEEEILPSAIFRITLQGETEAGAFGPFPGKLLILSSLVDGQSHYAISLVIDGPCRNGWVFWNGHLEIPASELWVNSGQVTVEHKGGDVPHPNVWWTAPRDSETAAPVHIERASLTISVRGDQVVGELTGTGVYQWGEHFNLPSSLQARFTGAREGGPALRQAQAAITAASRIEGLWNASDPLLGRLELREEEGAIEGSFSGNDQGHLSGQSSGSQPCLIDFHWESQRQEAGWGFLRVVSEGRLMAGLWGKDDEPAAARSLLLVREADLDLAGLEVGLEDTRELRAFAGDLIVRKEYDRAAALLEKAHGLYAVEIAASDWAPDDLLINQASALSWLAHCYFNLGWYDRLLSRLEAVIEIQRQLSPQPSLARLAQQRLAEQGRAAASARDLLAFFPELLAEISGGAGAMAGEASRGPALAEAADSLNRMLDALQLRLKSFEATSPEGGDGKALLSAISTQAVTIRDEAKSAIREIIALRSRLFSGAEELLQAANRLAEQFGTDASFDPQSLNLNDAVALEEEIVRRLKESLCLSRVEKRFFDLSMRLIGVLQTISFEFDHQRRFIEQMGIESFHENRSRQALEWAAGLADYLERWRERLLTDADKIAALAQGQPFLHQLVHFLVELGSISEALLVVEKSRARAYADLLESKARNDAAAGEDPAFAALRPSLSISPPPTLEDIFQIVRETAAPLDSNDQAAALREARRLYRLGRYAEAIEAARNVSAQAEESPEAEFAGGSLPDRSRAV